MQPIPLTYLAAVLATCAVMACASDETPQGALAAPVEVALAPYVGRLVTIDAVIGTDTARLIFDTGGGETVISPAIAERLGCVPSGRSVSRDGEGGVPGHTYERSSFSSMASGGVAAYGEIR